MLNVPVSIFDTLDIEIKEGEGIELISEGISAGVEAEDNIISRTATQFLARYDLQGKIKVRLHKDIPVGAGLGGGSSDAAAMLRVLCEHFNQEVDPEFAKSLGADVPYFLNPTPAWVWGIGEHIAPVVIQDLDRIYCVVCIPKMPLSTAEVFKVYAKKPQYSTVEDSLYRKTALTADEAITLIDNDLTEAAYLLYPALQTLMSEIRERTGLHVSLSGSGSAFFVISDKGRLSFDEIDRIMGLHNGYALSVSFT